MEGHHQIRQDLGGGDQAVVNVFYRVQGNVVFVRGAKGWEKTTIPIEIYRNNAPKPTLTKESDNE